MSVMYEEYKTFEQISFELILFTTLDKLFLKRVTGLMKLHSVKLWLNSEVHTTFMLFIFIWQKYYELYARVFPSILSCKTISDYSQCCFSSNILDELSFLYFHFHFRSNFSSA